MTFAQAAERHLDDVYGYLAWFTGDRTAAEDLAAETFERALRLWHRFDPERGSARTWLCQVARTVALDHFRSERRRTRREELAAPLGSNRDRHANIGEGLLGEALGVFLGNPRLQGLPAVLETAGPENRGPDANEVRKTKEIRARAIGG